MKLSKFICVFGVAAVAACGPKVADVTEITGTVAAEDAKEVRVQVGQSLDTLVALTDGAFSIVVPTDFAAYGVIRIPGTRQAARFIPDGTPLTVTFAEDAFVTSAKPEISVQERLNDYNKEHEELVNEYSSTRKKIYADAIMTQEEMDTKFEIFQETFMEEYRAYHLSACSSNSDNFISVIALSNLRGDLEDVQMDSLIKTLSPELQQDEYVVSMKQALEARINTAPGSKFVDFTAEHVYGYSRSMDPQPLKKEVKFSDYVGKGKYVLVDFWSPWCGPCRREVPNIKAVYDEYKKKGLEVLSLAVWERKPQSHTIEVAGELGMDWLHINNCGSVPTEIYGVEGIPHLMLIGPDGTILERDFHGPAGIVAAVEKYLK